MSKFRAVLLVPSVVEFECHGSCKQITKKAEEIAKSLGKTESIHPRQPNTIYAPKVMEVCRVGPTTPPPKKAA